MLKPEESGSATDAGLRMPEQAAVRVTRELRDLDKLILALPSMLAHCKVATLKRQAEAMKSLSSVLMLTILLDRPFSEVLDASDDLARSVRPFVQLASKSRLSLSAQLATRLLSDLGNQLHANIAIALRGEGA
ncbi:hypothetical protein ACNI65_21720 [Roseateles sp. So40a]|jgi:hypothetical protein|uniref:hypothetical protein n=1 Tax=Roseateles sp. So40a TaxID=3400226 RepID=UPI003A8C2111